MDDNQKATLLLSIRTTSVSLLTNESTGIWQRYNFFLAFEVALLAAAFLLLKENEITLYTVVSGLSLFGIYFTIFAMRVLDRLWAWHEAFFKSIQRVEKELPDEIPRVFQEFFDFKLADNAMKVRPEVRFPFKYIYQIIAPFFMRLLFTKDELNWFVSRTTHQLLSLIILLWFAILCFCLWEIANLVGTESLAATVNSTSP